MRDATYVSGNTPQVSGNGCFALGEVEICLWERAKYRTYVPEIIFVQFNSHMLHPVDFQFTFFIISLASVKELHANPYALNCLVNMPPTLQDGM